ncbi:hypothetical protein JYG23_00040 [Sedimentibacter sp. zth1]|uniref:hypothetical protein n=1 Tax=Sedimentibacter sp. zth1 TaxID=2816908 RepID=UPI001A913694|nr:hypothetical protein [Sedimentibacter sp. zth1]QSX05900.1 hypothetical protein JYG23_00040 [Sedimentibacter sp. zth1]
MIYLFTLDESIINFRRIGKTKEMIISNTYSFNLYMLGKANYVGEIFHSVELLINCNKYIANYDFYIDQNI